MARSTSFCAIFGATTLIIAISLRAALLPTVSIMWAACNVSSRAWSISMRDSAIHWRVTPCSAMVVRARSPPFALVDDVMIAIAHDLRTDVGRVGRRHGGLRHREGGTDLPVHQWLEPLLLLLRRGIKDQRFHVAGVRRRTIERLRPDRRAAERLADTGVFEIGQ